MDEATWKIHGGVRNKSLRLSHLRTMSGEEVGGAVNRWEGEGWRVRPRCSCIEIR